MSGGNVAADFVPDAEGPAEDAPDFHDRTGWLIGFGASQILIGMFATCLIPFTLVSVMMTNQMNIAGVPKQDVWQQAAGLVVFVVVAVFFIWSGIGAILCRRWVRPVMLSASGLWLAVGSIAMIALPITTMGAFDAAPPGAPPGARPPPQELKIVILIVALAFGFAFYIAMPAVFFVFYRWRDVKLTCEAKDPVERWTDRCPVAVLPVAFALVFTGITFLFMAPAYGLTPVFGALVTGWASVGMNATVGVAAIALGWSVYRRFPLAYFGAILLPLITGISSAVTFASRSVAEIYGAIGMPPEQIEFLEKTNASTPMVMALMSLGLPIMLAIYLVIIRRHYFGEMAPAEAETAKTFD